MPELHCRFAVYKMRPESCRKGNVRIYVHITYTEEKSVSCLPAMDLEYPIVTYEHLLDTNTLLDNLAYHFLEGELFSKSLDEYYH